MPFKRIILPESFKTGRILTADMVGIGMRFSGEGSNNPNIEDTLLAASIEGIYKKDARVMSLLTDWLTLHRERINVDRLTQSILALKGGEYWRIVRYWCANAQRFSSDPRFSRLSKFCSKSRRFNYVRIYRDEGYDDTDFLIEQNGEDERFKGTCLRIPKKVYRHRLIDITQPKVLAKRHFVYRCRIIMGANFRADLWAQLKQKPELSPAELARKCYSSYKASYFAKRDFELDRSIRKSRNKTA